MVVDDLLSVHIKSIIEQSPHASSVHITRFPSPAYLVSQSQVLRHRVQVMMSTTRRARGHYSSLICIRCRARKIKCFLPGQVSAPSQSPQPHHLACQRCKQNGFECVVESTVLGRPGASRPERQSDPGRPSNSASGDSEPSDFGTRGFLISQSYDGVVGGNRIKAEEVCEAMSSPLRFLSVLLSRHPNFGKDLSNDRIWNGPISLPQVISPATQDLLESRYVPCSLRTSKLLRFSG